MKILKNNKLTFSAVVFFMMAACAYSYPPDNAAVLYYKAAVLYEVDGEMANMLANLQKSKIEINDKIREFVKKNRLIINTVLDAAEVKNCDWGMDFSQGIAMEMPPLGSMRKLSRLVIAEANILAADEDYQAAISRCMSLYRIARHINDRIYISYLVGISINAITNNCVMRIMSDMPQDIQSLTWLKNQLIEIEGIPLSVKPAILGEREAVLLFMTPEQLPDIVKLCEVDKTVMKKILSLDKAAIDRNKEYHKNHIARIIDAFDMPYVEGYTTIKELHKKMKEDVKSNPDLFLTELLEPAVDRIFTLSIRFETHNNAIKTAIELYLIRAQTGKLPDELPVGLPKDLFSGKDFGYEKTADSFILRCQGKSLDKDEIYEYEFKVEK
jgi:flagellar basal body-associated protein FliL